MVQTLHTTVEFEALHELYGAEEGRSAFREGADGCVQRRVVRACRITTEAALACACRQLMPGGEDVYLQAHTLRELYAREGQALVYVEATHARRARPVFGSLRVGSLAQVLGSADSRLRHISRLRALPPLYQ